MTMIFETAGITLPVWLPLIFLHIAGVIVAGRLHDEHLVKAVFTGKKISRTDARQA